MVVPTALLVSNELDVGTDLVVRALRERDVAYYRLNTERLAEQSFVWKYGVFSLRSGRDVADLSQISTVLFRQPVWPAFEGSAAEVDVFQNQWRAVIRGLTSIGASWINPIDAGLAAESKIAQLSCAQRVGFDCPDTCITNSRDELLDFVSRQGRPVVAKALDSPFIDDGSTRRFLFTSPVSKSMLEGPLVDSVPMIFQEEIIDKLDVRIVVIDDDSFAFSIIPGVNELDWRRTVTGPSIQSITAPLDIIRKCRLFLSALGLRFGAFDFAVRADRYVFLECNQNGEWGWLERATGAPIAHAIVSAMNRPAARRDEKA